MLNPVNWFEIPVADLERARRFYEQVLRCKMTVQDFGRLKMALFPGEQNGPNSTGSLVMAQSYVPSHQGSMVYFNVDDIAETLDRVVQAGGVVLNPKTSIGDFGFVAHFEDSEGNRVALHSTN